jgi:hypothetical protein
MLTATAAAYSVTEPPGAEALIERIRSEFLEMPGLRLTCQQASRLWHLDDRTCDAVLQRLVGERFLWCTASGAFVRADRT